MKTYTTEQVIALHKEWHDYNEIRRLSEYKKFGVWLKDKESKQPEQVVVPQWIQQHNSSLGNQIRGIEEGKVIPR